jgi:type II secretory pathway component PulF
MAKSSSFNFKIRSAAWEFKAKRGEFYLDIASVMEASPGEAVTKILQRYADRYPKEPLGILSRHWLDRFQDVGTFSESMRGTIPTEDLAVLSASESAGDLRVGLESLGRNLASLNATKSEITKTMVSAVMLILFLHIFLGIEAFLVMPKLQSAMKGTVDITNLGKSGALFFGAATVIRNWWWAWALFLGGAITLVSWALKNYVGRSRKWLDAHFLPFQMARDFNAASFFSTVGAITGSKGAQVVQLNDALSELGQHAYPWLKWQIKQIQENLQQRPNSKGEIFDTGIANKRTYYRILDIADHSEMSEMLKKVGDIILKSAPEEIKAKATVVRFALMAICLTTMIGIYGGTYSLIDAFKAASQMKAMQ